MERARPIRTIEGPDGTILYVVSCAPQALPPVRTGDLADAWHEARLAATHEVDGASILIRFAAGDGPVDLTLTDRDACCWAAAIDRSWGLDRPYGLSLCLRLLGLVDLLAAPAWAARFCHLTRADLALDPSLLRAVANAQLSDRAQLPRAALEAALGVPAPVRT